MVPFEWQFLTHSGLSRASNVQGDFSCFGAKIGDFCRWSVEGGAKQEPRFTSEIPELPGRPEMASLPLLQAQ